MKCLMLIWSLESGQVSHKIFCFIQLLLNLRIYTCFVNLQPFCVTLDFKLSIDSIHILFLLYLLLWFWDFTIKNLQDFINTYRARIKDIFHRTPPTTGHAAPTTPQNPTPRPAATAGEVPLASIPEGTPQATSNAQKEAANTVQHRHLVCEGLSQE